MPEIYHFLTNMGKYRHVVRIELWGDNEMHYVTRVFVSHKLAKEWRHEVLMNLSRGLIPLKYKTTTRKAA